MRDPVYNPAYSYAVLACTVLAAAFVATRSTIPQPLAYNVFCDQRSWLGIPNTLNVLSNIPFLVVGVWGIVVVMRRDSRAVSIPSERWPYLVLFIGVALTCFGSAYYHWSPDNDRLVWDRLPMAIGFMGLLAATINERTVAQAGSRLLIPLLLFGIISVIYWHASETWGQGDLRLYLFVQFGSLSIILALMAIFVPRYSHSGWMLLGLLLYVVAKFLELYDRQIFEQSRAVSGHTLKHLVAAISVGFIVQMLRKRELIAAADRVGAAASQSH
jgi:hypothetical protein